MRTTTSGTQAAWLSGDYVGINKPMVRATIQRLDLTVMTYGKQQYSSVPFGQANTPVELPNIKDVKWTRTTDGTATMNMTLYNTEPLPMGEAPQNGDFDQIGYYCADTETEALERSKGWVRYDALEVGDEIYTLNCETGLAEWKPVLEVFSKRYEGKLVSLEGESLSALVTSAHRWPVTDKYRRRHGHAHKFRETSDLKTFDDIPLIAPSADSTTGSDDRDFAALMGWIITDGTYQKKVKGKKGMKWGGKRVTIYQSWTANRDKCLEIRALLERIGEPFSEYRSGNIIHFRFSNGLARRVRAAAPDKALSMSLIESFNAEAQTALLDSLIKGDGTVEASKNERCTPRRRFMTSRQEDADLFAALAARLGHATTTSSRMSVASSINGHAIRSVLMYLITIKRRSHTSLRGITVGKRDYADVVWCPRTENGTFLARRNGHVYFTGNSPLRGNTAHSSRWDRTANGWQDWIVPDRLIRTFEGYGFDVTVAPEVDPHLYPSGVWRIDDVTFTQDGFITIACRDIGSILTDSILFPPVVPFAFYPVWFETVHQVANPPVVTSSTGWSRPSYATSSNYSYVGNGAVYGHTGTDAFDTNDGTYWLSIGNAHPDADYSFEFIEGNVNGAVSAMQVHVWGGPYTMYVSVYAAGKWQGDQTVPYNPDDPISAPNGANIRYLSTVQVPKEGTVTFNLPKPVTGASRVRVTFTNLCDSGLGPYRYRAGVRSMQVATTSSHTSPGGTHQEPATFPPGVRDYSDIVKIMLAWAGFYWPRESTHAFTTLSDGTRVTTVAPSNDPALIQGRVWGDIEMSGTSPLVAMPVSEFDKLPVKDGIQKIADIVAFLFFIDDTGGAVFRSPNIWSVGNWIGDGGPSSGRTTTVVDISEMQTLMALSATMSSRSIREKIFVGNISGQIAAMANGHNPYPAGLRRISGWTDQHFKTNAECQIMADLISLRQLFTYRTDKLTIPGNPAIQVDDQVRIYERVSEEAFLHYVQGISMNWSVETGKYTYELDTHWLGDSTFDNWTFNPASLSAEAQTYLRNIGKIP